MHGETEARGAQGALHLTEQEFNRTVPTVMQKADLKQKAVQLSDFEVNQSNIKTISPEDRINLEWGSDKKYEKAIDKLLKQARKSNFPVEDIPKFSEEELRKRNMLDPESLKGLIIPSLLGSAASLNEGENLDTMGNQSRIIGAEKRKPK